MRCGIVLCDTTVPRPQVVEGAACIPATWLGHFDEQPPRKSPQRVEEGGCDTVQARSSACTILTAESHFLQHVFVRANGGRLKRMHELLTALEQVGVHGRRS